MNSRFATVLLICLGIALGAPAIGLPAAYWWFQSSDNLAPWVNAGGIDVGGMSRAQAAQAINQAWNEEKQIVLTDGTQSWRTQPIFVGIWVDPAKTIQQAYEVGRGQDGLTEWAQLLHTREKSIEPVVQFNPETARANLERWAQEVNQAPQNADLRIEAGKVVTVAGQPGKQLDTASLVKQFKANPEQALLGTPIQVNFLTVDPKIADLAPAAAQAQTLLDQAIKISLYDPISDEHLDWQIPHDRWAGWIQIKQTETGPQAVLDQNQLVTYLQDLQNQLDAGNGRTVAPLSDPAAMAAELLAGKPVTLVLRHPQGETVAQAGETLLSVGWRLGIPYWRMMKANPGVNVNALAAGQKLIVPSPDDLLPLPVVLNKRIVISIAKQHMWVYENGEQIRDFVISTGISSSPTQPGIFQVQTHELNAYASNWDLYMPHWMGIYEAWPGFMNGIHGLPMLSSGVRLWANVLGHPASYGCIILDLPSAEWLYTWAENGVVVEIDA